MKSQIKGPAIFLAQFASDQSPFNNLDSITKWAASLGYKGVQIPSWDDRFMDIQKAAESKDYCDEIKGIAEGNGVEITELSTHIQGQLVATHPAYDSLYDNFAAPHVKGDLKARQAWATEQLIFNAKASYHLGLKAHATFSGSLAFPFLYPWPQRPQGLIDDAFDELAKRWLPILNAFDEVGVDVAYELHPGEDLFDGTTFERFLEKVGHHERCSILYDPSHFVLQALNYLDFIDIYHERIKAFHVKDAEFNPSGRQGVYSGYSDWIDRAGRFRSLGDGQVDFRAIFSKLTQYGFDRWAVLEWECCIKEPVQGATEGAKFIKEHLIIRAEKAFDDFAATGIDKSLNKKILGL